MRWAASVVCSGRGIWLRCRWLRFLHRRCLFCWAASVLRGHFRLGDSSAVRLLALLLKATNNYTFLSLVETEKQLLLLLRVSRSIGQHLYLVIKLMLKLPMIGCFGYQCRPLYQRIQSRVVHVASTDTVGRIQKLFLN